MSAKRRFRELIEEFKLRVKASRDYRKLIGPVRDYRKLVRWKEDDERSTTPP